MDRLTVLRSTVRHGTAQAARWLTRGASQAAVLEYGLIALSLVVAVITAVGAGGADLIGKLGWIHIQYTS